MDVVTNFGNDIGLEDSLDHSCIYQWRASRRFVESDMSASKNEIDSGPVEYWVSDHEFRKFFGGGNVKVLLKVIESDENLSY